MKTFTVNDLDKLQKEFYQMYDPDYWLYKVTLLKNTHDSFDDIENTLTKGIEEVEVEKYKRMIRTELHFLYFQMIETLFEIIFALKNNDNRDLWAALTFSNDRNTHFYSETYNKIEELSDVSSVFTDKVQTEIDGKGIELPFLRWLLYFVYPTTLDNKGWQKNLANIKRLLLMFANDFTDRGEYNAYKHSLRFYNAPFKMMIGLGRNNVHHLGSSDDCITFLEARKKNDGEGKMVRTGQIARVQKPFDFERDYTMCILIYSMIKNIVFTRKHSLLTELDGISFDMVNFVDIDFSKTIPRTTITKTSFAV
ncbi:MAG: hypothetical protein WDZ88_02440 [Candidatus Paceibacterota bacterium]